MNEKYYQTLKSAETEDWLDLHVIRPFCYYCAVFFAKFDIHPNTVTIWSMVIGAASAFFFAQGSFHYGDNFSGNTTLGLVYNIIAIFLLMWADILDCTDGQLARMTGKKSRMGRILDGVAGFAWFIPIYVLLTYRFYLHHDWEFSWLGIENNEQNTLIATAIVFGLGLISGIAGLAGQQRLADYYIQVHLFFLKGEKGSELDNSVRQQEIYDQMGKDVSAVERYFQKSYISYTQKQEKATPQFQRLLAALREKYGSLDNIPADIRKEFHDYSLPVIKWNGLLTFNFREFWLFLFCLLDVPAALFVWEIVGMGLLCLYVNKRHEAFCKKMADKL
ncbi:MAG: CDP-alcohol phosphatidyltransferase family protein [Prevotella sp.]|jgi:phosphatidylglycerophosphate synthase|nr:CDP-alcohol phosphatidyltransferase family protein [Prevotella sp.]